VLKKRPQELGFFVAVPDRQRAFLSMCKPGAVEERAMPHAAAGRTHDPAAWRPIAVVQQNPIVVVQQKLSKNAKNIQPRRPPIGADKKTSSSGFAPVDRVSGGEYISLPSGCRA
jgi:hypothetical protein